jgi:hypothetical protein
VSPVASDKYLPTYNTGVDLAVCLEQIAMNETSDLLCQKSGSATMWTLAVGERQGGRISK